MANTQGSRKVVDLSNSLYLLDPTAAPLWVLADRLSRRDCVNTKVEWLFQPGKSVIPEYNYCQIFRKNAEVTKTLMAQRHYGNQDRQYQRKKKGIELMRDFECAMIFGNRLEHNYIRSMGGLNFFDKIYSKVLRKKYSWCIPND